MTSKKKMWQPKPRNEIVQALIESEGAGAGFHEVHESTAYARGWRRRRKHKRTLLEDYFEGEFDDFEDDDYEE